MGLAQSNDGQGENRFYIALGIRDAQHEISNINRNIEDESDFWEDQKVFEKLLMARNLAHYQSYLNGKAEVYRQHKIHCGERCDHSEQFARQIAFYIIKGNPSTNAEVVFAPKGRKLNKQD